MTNHCSFRSLSSGTPSITRWAHWVLRRIEHHEQRLQLGLLAGAELLWFFLGEGDETHTLSVWACPLFQLVRVSETRSPIRYNVLENGDIRLFNVAQSLA